MGDAIGYRGGVVQFCEVPTLPGRRFCDRCHIIRLNLHIERIRSLEAVLAKERLSFEHFLQESKIVLT